MLRSNPSLGAKSMASKEWREFVYNLLSDFKLIDSGEKYPSTNEVDSIADALMERAEEMLLGNE